MNKFVRVLLLGFAFLVVAVEVQAGQQVTAGTAPPEDAQLKDRIKLLYQDLLKGDRVAALALVAPDSQNQFLNIQYAGMTDYRVVGVDVEQSGDKAKARVIRVTRVPGVSQPFDLEVVETWQRSNGQWYLVLPPPGELDTPFGKMKFNKDKDNGKQDDATADAMKQKIQMHYKDVDPDQYIRALQKVAIDPTTVEVKPADKQPPQPASSSTQSNKPPTQP